MVQREGNNQGFKPEKFIRIETNFPDFLSSRFTALIVPNVVG
jgi:hypothetical protein